jgi:hypothetical protein
VFRLGSITVRGFLERKDGDEEMEGRGKEKKDETTKEKKTQFWTVVRISG